VEQLGVARSKDAAQQSDLVLLTIDAARGWTGAEMEIYQQVQSKPVILVINKIDLVSKSPVLPLAVSHHPQVTVSALQQEGIDRLESAILAIATAGELQSANVDFTVNQRQAAALTRALTALENVQESIRNELPWDFWTIDLRAAIQALGEITGEDLVESVLDKIFSRFCIGK
jgi:tRNA modification GTPase